MTSDRREKLERALKLAKPKEEFSLDTLAAVYGVHKGRMSSQLRVIGLEVALPEPVTRGQTHYYPARATLKAILKWLTRNDLADEARAKRSRAIIGEATKVAKGQRSEPLPDSAELMRLSRLMDQAEERERKQRLYIPRAEVEQVAASVYGKLAEFFDPVSAKIDPNGQLPDIVRARADQQGKDTLLQIRRELDQLLADADELPSRTSPNRTASRGAGGAQARRQRS